MARAHFVKSARKDNPVAKKGESYWWWKPMIGGRGGPKRYSKERPKPSQMTQSAFLSAIYGASEQLEEADTPEAFREIAEAVREAGQEARGSYDNMPDSLQQGETGQLLDERATNADSWADAIDQQADELESKLSEIDGMDAEALELEEDADESEIEEAREQKRQEAISECREAAEGENSCE